MTITRQRPSAWSARCAGRSPVTIALLSFEAGDPDWRRFPIAALAELPAPQFKLMNIRKFREASPERHKAVLNALEQSLA
jgi:hypothetical protein